MPLQRTNLTITEIYIVSRNRFGQYFTQKTVSYESGRWAVKNKERKCLETFQIWLWRREEKIIFREEIINEEVFRRIDDKRKLIAVIRKRKGNWIGHFLRKDCLQKLIMKLIIAGKRGRGTEP